MTLGELNCPYKKCSFSTTIPDGNGDQLCSCNFCGSWEKQKVIESIGLLVSPSSNILVEVKEAPVQTNTDKVTEQTSMNTDAQKTGGETCLKQRMDTHQENPEEVDSCPPHSNETIGSSPNSNDKIPTVTKVFEYPIVVALLALSGILANIIQIVVADISSPKFLYSILIFVGFVSFAYFSYFISKGNYNYTFRVVLFALISFKVLVMLFTNLIVPMNSTKSITVVSYLVPTLSTDSNSIMSDAQSQSSDIPDEDPTSFATPISTSALADVNTEATSFIDPSTPTETSMPMETVTPAPTKTLISIDTVTPEPTDTSVLTETVTPNPTDTPVPTKTVTPEPTDTPLPTNTVTPEPTETPVPTETVTPEPTDTPVPTETVTSEPTDTPVPTETFTPEPTGTPVPTETITPVPTDTATPQPTDTPVPTDTVTPEPTDTPVPTETVTPEPTDTPVPTETPPSNEKGEACSPGYWKYHLSSWTGYSTSDDFDATFGVDFFNPDITLKQSLKLQGGAEMSLARQGTAALLSAAHPDVHYPLTVAQVIALVQAGDVNTLAGYNKLMCPLNKGEDN